MMPTVEIVMCRADSPRSPWNRSVAVHTASRLAIGSPMPMNTMLLTRRSSCLARCDARTTCSTISPTVRCRVKPACPVAQKPQAIAQPAWLLTQTVARSEYSISTVSTRLPPSSSHRNLIVSPRSLTDSVTAVSDEGEFGVEPGSQRLGQVGDVGRIGELCVQPVPQLIEAVPRLAVEHGRQLVAREVVAGAHAGSIPPTSLARAT